MRHVRVLSLVISAIYRPLSSRPLTIFQKNTHLKQQKKKNIFFSHFYTLDIPGFCMRVRMWVSNHRGVRSVLAFFRRIKKNAKLLLSFPARVLSLCAREEEEDRTPRQSVGFPISPSLGIYHTQQRDTEKHCSLPGLVAVLYESLSLSLLFTFTKCTVRYIW